ncbi:MAG TPA: D-glycero-beta-D-manno-heptose-7-phosphate kinase, partial [Nitrospirae bacterium]|nr:D-glycero-beta-D-manno-heptose-7-phosphate kinase [Nitrospirota bacterium]
MRYNGIFKNFRKKKILVVGDIILDHYIWGLVERISPEAPVPVIDVKDENYTLGGAANVAANIVALGGKATVVGIRGDDVSGEVLHSLLNDRGIDTSGLFSGKRPTTIKTRVIAHSQQVVRFDREDRRRLDERL